MMRTNISDKLREIAAAIDQRGSANLTRLTVLKKWFGVLPQRRQPFCATTDRRRLIDGT
jgi:hypothetical protein